MALEAEAGRTQDPEPVAGQGPHRERRGAGAGRPLRRAALLVLLAGCSGSSKSTPPTPAGIDVVTEVDGLGQVTDLAFLPDGRMVITEKGGTVKLRAAAAPHEVTVAATFSVDTESEKGLLGVVVPPEAVFSSDQRVVFYRSVAGASDLDKNRVESFVLRQDGTLDLSTGRVLASGLRGPANHDGGGMVMGPDGMLYVGVGDSGSNSGQPPEPPQNPTNYFATCLTNGNGKILRLALDGSALADNPLAGAAGDAVPECGGDPPTAPSTTGPARRDLWAWGFRNPWRFAFDPATQLLWVADVGEVTYEELTIAQAGKHHGWPWREGQHGWPVSQCAVAVPVSGDCVDPVYECRHGAAAGGIDGDCQAITGGAFLTGPRWPAGLRQSYLFGDSQTQFLWTVQLTPDRRGVVPGSRQVIDELAVPFATPVSIRTGPEGDLYVALLSGQILRVTPR